jgi:molecular chaperone HscB
MGSSTTKTVVVKCAACDGPMASPVFCDHCRRLYPAESLNHFELLGLKPTYDVDPADLRRRYLRVSRGVHPDHLQEQAADPAAGLRVSAQLNEAQRVLRDPVLRAEYLLELHGGKPASEDRRVPEGVLAKTMLLREEIDEARAHSDTDALGACRQTIQQSVDDTLAEITQLAGALPGNEAQRDALRAALNAMKYYQRLQSECASGS